MNPTEFIYKNIQNQLINEGYSAHIANIAAQKGVDEYKRRPQATMRGRIYDDCLCEARLQAKLYKKATN